MTDLFAVYHLPASGRHLAIRLDAGLGGEPLRKLHEAAQGHAERLGLRVRRDLLGAPPAGAVVQPLTAYTWFDGSLNGARLGRHLQSLSNGLEPHRFQPRPGAVVEGRDLFAREGLLETLRRTIADKRSIHLMAPRRYGKTSLLSRLAEEGPCVFVDLSACANVLEATRALCDSAQSIGASTPAPDAAALWRALRRVLDDCASRNALLALDEFSLFLRPATQANDADARRFLHELQGARRRGLVCAVAGSTGLSSWIRLRGFANELEDLTPIEVSPLPQTDAEVLFEEIVRSANVPLTADAPATAIGLLGDGEAVPYFVHLLADAVIQDLQGPSEVAGPSQVSRAFETRLMGTWANHAFRHFSPQHQPYTEALQGAAVALFGRLSLGPATREDLLAVYGSADPDRFDDLLTCLQEDFDIWQLPAGSWGFRSRVLRERFRREAARKAR